MIINTDNWYAVLLLAGFSCEGIVERWCSFESNFVLSAIDECTEEKTICHFTLSDETGYYISLVSTDMLLENLFLCAFVFSDGAIEATNLEFTSSTLTLELESVTSKAVFGYSLSNSCSSVFDDVKDFR